MRETNPDHEAIPAPGFRPPPIGNHPNLKAMK